MPRQLSFEHFERKKIPKIFRHSENTQNSVKIVWTISWLSDTFEDSWVKRLPAFRRYIYGTKIHLVKNQRDFEIFPNFVFWVPSINWRLMTSYSWLIDMSHIKDNFEPISFYSQKMEIVRIACLRKIASLKIRPKFE